MRGLVQRVVRARVSVAGSVTGEIGAGLLVLLGIRHRDGEAEARWLAGKIAGLRVFGDVAARMNLDVRDVGGAVLVVPQFTLYGDVRQGRRPDFMSAAPPDLGRRLYEAFCGVLRANGLTVSTGVFGAAMRVQIDADGPVTIVASTDRWTEGEL